MALMIKTNKTEPETAPDNSRDNGKNRRVWVRPAIIDRGDVRDITLGPTAGVGESGNPAIFKN
jgi:hypothetical protein